MNEDTFTLQLRKLRETVGVSPWRESEEAARATVTVADIELAVDIDGAIAFA
jgi:histone H3/H4